MPGRLKIFLGYAAGVGKTYQMLDECHALKAKGVDIVIGYFEPHGRKDTIEKMGNLELIPRRKVEYRGSLFEEMDLDAILARHPRTCAVDELPHTNIPGLRHEKRWQDVLDLLDADIDVFTTMNIQHLESLNDQVWQIAGVRVRETIPDWLMTRAGDVVMVDVTPRALLNRLERGVVYQPDKAKQAIEHFFKESTLVALREVAMRQTAHEVEMRNDTSERAELLYKPRSLENILILVTDDPSTAMLIRRGKRVADYLQASCSAVHIHHERDFLDVPLARRQIIERHLNFARNLHVETSTLQGDDLAASLIEFARLRGITQIFIARPKYEGLQCFPGRNLIHRVVRLARDMQVTVVAQRNRGA